MNYQEKVSTRADVKNLYERVIEQPNIKMYRGYTSTKSYGWDEEADDCVKRDGEAWFENPSYFFLKDVYEEKIKEEIKRLSDILAFLLELVTDQHADLIKKEREIKTIRERIEEGEGDVF